MSEEKRLQESMEQESEVKDVMNDTAKAHELSPTWAHDVIEDLDEWIESQGIYLRQ